MRTTLLLFITTTSLVAEPLDNGVVSIVGLSGTEVRNRSLGFIVEKEGFVLTNYQNLTSEPDGRLLEQFEVKHGSSTYKAEIIGVEPTINIGILKLQTEETFMPVVCAVKREITAGMPLRAVSLNGDSMRLIDGSVTAEMARSETETLRERINSGLAEARRKGVKLGRPTGTGLEAAELLAKHKDVVRLLKDGQSVRNAAKITGKGPSTVQRVKAALAA